MSKGFLYYYKRSFINKIKKRPFKTIFAILLGIYFMLLPLLLKEMIKGFGMDKPLGYIAIYSIFSIYLGMPSLLTYFKRKGLIFKEADVNFIFTSPISPKAIIIFGMAKNIFVYILQYITYFVAMVFVFHIPVNKAIIVAIGGIIFTNMIEISLALIMYGSEKITLKAKKTIKIFVFILLGSILGIIAINLMKQGFTAKNLMNFLTGDLIMIVPVFGWEIGFIKLILLGPTTYNIIATALYIFSAIVLFILAYKMKLTGEFFEEALSFSQEYEKALEKSKDGGFAVVGKKAKVRKIEFSTKGKYAKAIFFKQLDEFKKTSLLSRFGKTGMFLIASIAIGIILRINKEKVFKNISDDTLVVIFYGISTYFAIFFSKINTWRKEFDNHLIYLIPDSTRNKILYSTLFQDIKYLVEGIVISTPIILLVGFPIYLIPVGILIYAMTNITILYVDLILREILTGKIGDALSQFIMLFVDMIVLVIGGLIIGLTGSTGSSPLISTTVLIIYLLIMSFIGLTLSSKLYRNMEFVTKE